MLLVFKRRGWKYCWVDGENEWVLRVWCWWCGVGRWMICLSERVDNLEVLVIVLCMCIVGWLGVGMVVFVVLVGDRG